jgi:hypothetical protein
MTWYDTSMLVVDDANEGGKEEKDDNDDDNVADDNNDERLSLSTTAPNVTWWTDSTRDALRVGRVVIVVVC